MPPRHRPIHDSAPLRRLIGAQVRALAPRLERCFGTRALLLGAGSAAVLPALPSLAHRTTLQVVGERYAGDLHAALDEPLPFVDEAFELVFVCHALEVVPQAPAVLREAIRVLAPGGTLAVAGVHPLSGWAPWFCWHARGSGARLQAPRSLARELRHAGLEVEAWERNGALLPGMQAPAAAFGGGYALVARKRQRKATLLRLRPAPVRMAAGARLSPGTRRSAI